MAFSFVNSYQPDEALFFLMGCTAKQWYEVHTKIGMILLFSLGILDICFQGLISCQVVTFLKINKEHLPLILCLVHFPCLILNMGVVRKMKEEVIINTHSCMGMMLYCMLPSENSYSSLVLSTWDCLPLPLNQTMQVILLPLEIRTTRLRHEHYS